ncbi:XRE family transcriptional regulator [Defluviimonas sp. WL0024]|uniref:XRE family transcriptional regulator n=1 Tax=Albidovulum salinarum TaxID=2984153 RepID=A0ABT2X2T1_9RHOB|nr:XRE family transcriptional regulator [Defluviimonas sp. WL0024]MCU9848263.1 XRE family transcriptional regulator [Defluviimonas sp. WL0024]
MLSETLNDRLEAYRIGQKVRGLRTAKGLGLEQLGDHSGLSAGMLSRIERGQLFPTLPTLMRIALVFGVGLEHFFAEGEVVPIVEIVRKKERIRLPNTPSGEPTFHFESLDFPVTDRRMEAYLAEFPPGAPASAPHSHAGVEIVYVMSGSLGIDIHGKRRQLDAGDSIYFESEFDHSYVCLGDEPCRALTTVTSEIAADR